MKTLKIIIVLGFVLVNSMVYSQNETVLNEKPLLDTKTNSSVRYHYFPNLQAYFDNLKNVYYFQENKQWITAEKLPTNYGGYSLYNKARVLITDYDGENPQQFLNSHKKLYPYNSKGRITYATVSYK